MLPEGWKETTVGKGCSIKNNIRTPINENDRKKIQGIYPYYGPTGILGYIDRYQIDEDFSLIGEDGDHFLKYKDKEMTIFYSGKACINNHAHVICNSDKCLAKWFYLYFLHRDITKYITRQGAKRFKLNKNSLESIPIVIPPLPEQEKIAAILSTWDKAISTADALLENSRKQKKALMQQLLTGKRRLPGFTGEWRFLQAKKLFTNVSIKHKPDEQLLAVTQDNGVIPRNLLDRRVVMPEGDVSNYKFVKKGNFIISLRSFQGGLEYSDFNGLVSPAYTVIEKCCDLFDRFYKHYFKSTVFIGKLAIAVIGIRDGKQISYDDFACISLPVPPLDEQRAIAAVLDAADREISLLEQKAARLREEKKALMQQLLTGKRRVQV